MSLSNIVGLLEKYANPGQANHADAQQDFQQVSQTASPTHLSNGLSQAFQSNQTPPFPQMLATLFQSSNGQQQAGILNQLLGALGPGAAAASGMPGLAGGSNQVTPQQAQQVSPETVQQLAAQAHQKDPSIIQQASDFYAQHPTLVQALGAGSLALIMSHMSRQS